MTSLQFNAEVCVITCPHYRTETLLLANRLVSVHAMNLYVVGTCMYNHVTKMLPETLHRLNTRQAKWYQESFCRHQMSRFRIKKHRSDIWNSFLSYIEIWTSIMDFKGKLHRYLIEKNLLINVTQCWRYTHISYITVHVYVYICVCICTSICITCAWVCI